MRDGKKRELVSDEGRIGGAVQFAGAFRGCMRGESNGGTDAPWKSSSGALQFRTMVAFFAFDFGVFSAVYSLTQFGDSAISYSVPMSCSSLL